MGGEDRIVSSRTHGHLNRCRAGIIAASVAKSQSVAAGAGRFSAAVTPVEEGGGRGERGRRQEEQQKQRSTHTKPINMIPELSLSLSFLPLLFVSDCQLSFSLSLSVPHGGRRHRRSKPSTRGELSVPWGQI